MGIAAGGGAAGLSEIGVIMTRYRVDRREEGIAFLVLIDADFYHHRPRLMKSGRLIRQVWVLVKVRKQSKACAECQENLQGQMAYAPITNLDNRGERLCRHCVESAPVFQFR